MKYIINKGSATIPLSEFNRLNEFNSDLKSLEKELYQYKDDLEKSIENNSIVIYRPSGSCGYLHLDYLRPEYELVNNDESNKYKDILKNFAINEAKVKLSKMSIFEFIKFKYDNKNINVLSDEGEKSEN